MRYAKLDVLEGCFQHYRNKNFMGSAKKIIKIRPTVAQLSVKNHFPIVNSRLNSSGEKRWLCLLKWQTLISNIVSMILSMRKCPLLLKPRCQDVQISRGPEVRRTWCPVFQRSTYSFDPVQMSRIPDVKNSMAGYSEYGNWNVYWLMQVVG